MSHRVIAVGDIHGCAEALRGLMEVVEPQAEDQIIILGDYVDRGPNTRDVLEQLLELKKSCQLFSLAGNHEVMMLDALLTSQNANLEFWMRCGGEETLASYGGDATDIPQSHLDFLQQALRYHETDTHLFVHANYAPHLPLEHQPDQMLFWQHLGIDPAPHKSGKITVLGHTPQITGEVLDLGHVICIDTFCFGSGWLTGFDVHSGEIWQVDKQGQIRLTDEWPCEQE